MANFSLIDRGDQWFELLFEQPGSVANVLNESVFKEFSALLDNLEKRSDIKGLVFTSAKKTIFIAGADVNLIKSLDTFDRALKACSGGQQMIHRISKLPFETVAAISGACLGGGLELSLACTKRVASTSKNVKIGLPEVQLGILPGFGGSIRLPRVTSLPFALDMILTGKQIDGKRAWKNAIVSAVLPEQDFNKRALEWAKKNAGKPPKYPKSNFMSFFISTPIGRAMALNTARKGVMNKTKGHYPSPLKILDLLGKTLGKSDMDWCLEQEAKHFASLAITPISKRLIELFLLTEKVKKNNGTEAEPAGVERGAVLGAGIMGGGISHAFANIGIPVRMKDLDNEAIVLGHKQAAEVFGKRLKRRRMTKTEFDGKMRLISGTQIYSGFKTVDVVVEAIVENMEIKKKVIQETEMNISDSCVIASNTSSLSISEMQSVSKIPERIAGMHFFNPVDRMPLVEVIAGDKTSEKTISTLYELAKRMRKTPVVVKDCPGFLVNRLLLPYMNESVFLLQDGVSIDRIDRVMLQFGMPMGPLRLADEVGLDTAAKVAKILNEAYGKRAEAAPLTGKIAESGRLGRKNRKGFYVWEKDKARRPDESIYEFVDAGGKSASLSDEELVDRMISPMINEAALALQEGVVKTPGELDLALIMGTGFPPFRGGLLRYADSIGVDRIRNNLDRFSQGELGERLLPNPALSEFADRGTFYG